MIWDVISSVLLVTGSVLALTTAIGLIRFPTPCPGCTRPPNRRRSACC